MSRFRDLLAARRAQAREGTDVAAPEALAEPSAAVAEAPAQPVTPEPERPEPVGAPAAGTWLLPPQAIRPAANIRQDFTHLLDQEPVDNVAEIRESIRAHGQLEPVGVSRHPEGHWQLEFGETRYRALSDLHTEDPARWPGILAVEVPYLEGLDRELRQHAETMKHFSFRPLDEAAWLARLAEQHGLGPTELASRLGSSKSRVSKLLRLNAAPEPIRQAVRSGRLSLKEATEREPERLLRQLEASPENPGASHGKPTAARAGAGRPAPRVPVALASVADLVDLVARLAERHQLSPVELPAKPARKDLVAVLEQRAGEVLAAVRREGGQ